MCRADYYSLARVWSAAAEKTSTHRRILWRVRGKIELLTGGRERLEWSEGRSFSEWQALAVFGRRERLAASSLLTIAGTELYAAVGAKARESGRARPPRGRGP